MRVFPYLALALGLALSCTSYLPDSGDTKWGRLSLSVETPDTRVFGEEDAVSSLCVMVFYSDGSLRYRHLGGLAVPDITVPLGELLDIWAIANWRGEDLSMVETEEELASLRYKVDDAVYEDESGWHVLMAVKCAKVFTLEQEELHIMLERKVADIMLESIEVDMDYMESEYDSSPDCVMLDGIYLINCVEEITLGGEIFGYCNRSGNASSIWASTGMKGYNPGSSYPSLDAYKLTKYLESSSFSSSGNVYSLESCPLHLYCLPNPSDGEYFGPSSDWLPRPTRVVASFYAEDVGWYEFPLTIRTDNSGVMANYRYTVNYRIGKWNGYSDMDRDTGYMYSDFRFNLWKNNNYEEKL